jgi:hypothetical protein
VDWLNRWTRLSSRRNHKPVVEAEILRVGTFILTLRTRTSIFVFMQLPLRDPRFESRFLHACLRHRDTPMCSPAAATTRMRVLPSSSRSTLVRGQEVRNRDNFTLLCANDIQGQMREGLSTATSRAPLSTWGLTHNLSDNRRSNGDSRISTRFVRFGYLQRG